MSIDQEFLEALKFGAMHVQGSRTLPWPKPGAAGGLVTFANFGEWQAAILDLALPEGIPTDMVRQYDRARKAYLVAWLDFDLVILAEMAAMSALEHCLGDCYLGAFQEAHTAAVVSKAKSENRQPKRKENFRPQSVGHFALLQHMVKKDGLTNDQIPCAQKYGGQILGLLDGKARGGLASMRNVRMHGDPFGSGYLSGLLELVRDLIAYAYRNRIEVAKRQSDLGFATN